MQESLANERSPRPRQLIAIYLLAFLLLILGVLIGRQAEGFFEFMARATGRAPFELLSMGASDGSALFHTIELVALIAFAITLLAGWTAYLSIRAVRLRHQIADSKRKLQQEIERQRSTTDELHITHQQLSSTASQLGGILEGTTDFIAAIDPSLRYVSLNDAYRKNILDLFKKEPEVGMSVEEALMRYPSKRDHSIVLWKRALAGEKFNATQEFTDDLGNTFYYEVTYNPIFDENGTVTGAAQINRDVTERRRTEERLRQEMDFVSAAIDVNSSLVIVLDLEGRIVRFNQACERLSGYAFEEVKGRVFWNVLIPTEDISKIKATYRNFYSTFFSEDYVNQWITKDEKLRLISWQVSAIKDELGNVKYIVGTGIDITEKREIETARNRMLKILENSPDLISIHDFQGRMTYLNPAGRSLLDLSKHSDIGNVRLSSFQPEDVDNLIQAEAIPTAVKKGSWLGTTALRLKDGTEIPTSQLILAHQNEKGKVEYFSTLIRDISSQKQLEENLEEARDRALEAIRNKSDFLANMSHEIRTPMSGIIGISELLLGTSITEEQRDYTETIQKCGEALLTIINDILDFSKLEAGKFQFESVDFDLNAMVDSVSELFAQTVYRKGLELSVLVNRDVPAKLKGDPGRVRQVLTNLVSNAVKFTDSGEIVVRVSLESGEEDHEVRFSVTDTGAGVPKDAQETLFLPYSQAGPTSSREYGTGLGLAICKQIVDMLGGEIGLESEPGNGSVFWFVVPFERAEDSVNRHDIAGLANKRMLVIDDNDTNRRILLHQAKTWGMYVDESGSGESGLAVLKAAARNREPFDFVVVDIGMPGMSGIDFTEQVKADLRLRHTKVILMSSAANRPDPGYVRENADAFVSKPLRLNDLLETLAGLGSDNRPTADIAVQEQPENGMFDLGDLLDHSGVPRILVAEDNLVNSKVIYNQVLRMGYEVDVVQNGFEVLEAVARNDYALVLMDCEMPRMDGFEATRKIRESERGESRLPIIAVTAHALTGERDRCFASGMDDYLSKPTRQKELQETISRWLGDSPGAYSRRNGDRRSAGNKSEAENIDERLRELEDACGPEVVAECISLFTVDSGMAVENLARALEDEDFDRAAAEAHKLKGSTANMGALGVSDICQELMSAARKKQKKESSRLLDTLTSQMDAVSKIYTGHLAGEMPNNGREPVANGLHNA